MCNLYKYDIVGGQENARNAKTYQKHDELTRNMTKEIILWDYNKIACFRPAAKG